MMDTFPLGPPGWLIVTICALMFGPIPEADGARGDELIVGEDQPPPHFNPVYADDMYVVRAIELIYDGLVGYDLANKAGTPQLARAWRYDAALPGFEFELREDVRWHDGAPFTSRDVVFTVGLMRTSHLWFRDLVADARPSGDHRVTLQYVRPPDDPAEALTDLTFKILPSHLFPPGTTRILPTDRINAHPIGTGPYRFVEQDGDRVFLTRAEGPRPRSASIERLQLHGASEKDLQKDSLRTKLLGMIVRLRPKDVKEVDRELGKVEVFEYASLNWWYLAYNHRRPHVRDLAVREAITLALDREKMRDAHLGDGWTISGPFAHRDLRNPQAAPPRPHDPAAARARLLEAGYRTNTEGRLLDPHGRAVSLRLLVQPPLGQSAALFTDMQNQLKAIGVELHVDKPADIPAWRSIVKRGDGYDMVVGRWRPNPGDFIRPLFHSTGDLNWFGYRNPAIDKLLDAYRDATTGQDRRARLIELHRALAADLPYTFLWSLNDYSAYRKEEFERLNLIHPYYYFTHVHQWRRRSRR